MAKAVNWSRNSRRKKEIAGISRQTEGLIGLAAGDVLVETGAGFIVTSYDKTGNKRKDALEHRASVLFDQFG